MWLQAEAFPLDDHRKAEISLGQLLCMTAGMHGEGASPGVLKPWPANPHWFAYEGKTPVFLKSYYNKAGGSQRQDAEWFDKNFYTKLAERGYNHHMASGFLPVLPLSALWCQFPSFYRPCSLIPPSFPPQCRSFYR